MKTLSTALQNHLMQEVTTLATCWKLTRRDAVVLGFTDHDRPILFEGVTYEAASGLTPTAIAGSATLAVDNLDIEGMLDSAVIDEADILAGLYDFAEIEVFQVNVEDVTQGALPLRFGWLGEVTWSGEQFTAEIRGLTQKLTQTVGSVYSPTCRAELGDTACKVDMGARTVTGSLTSVDGTTILFDSSRGEISDTYAHGVLTFTGGANDGIAIEVKAYQPGQITLMLPLPYAPSIGDTYVLSEGCDKRFTTCKTRFSNAINFRGEPHVPGFDRLLETATTRSG